MEFDEKKVIIKQWILSKLLNIKDLNNSVNFNNFSVKLSKMLLKSQRIS